jgi:hypothetical protein
MKANPKKQPPTPEPMKMWEWALILCIAVVLACVSIPVIHDFLENRKAESTKRNKVVCWSESDATGTSTVLAESQEVCDKLKPNIKSARHHSHTKDAAETARLNRQMLEQHAPQ